jgi:DNA/RNA-binding domain of Phe-tRNA-synthetase-like protein
MIEMSEDWKRLYPGAVIGVLMMRGARNPSVPAHLETLRESVETELRGRFAAGGKEALKADPVMAAYQGYYRPFRKTYHVMAQIESVVWKGRHIPSVSALVQAMFMAELKNGLLTAGHDLARVALPIRIGVGTGAESYTGIGGEERVPKEGDMLISDGKGVMSSILYGPDTRTAIGADTRDLLFTVYAPAGIGIDRVRAHLEDIRGFVLVVASEAVTETLAVSFDAGGRGTPRPTVPCTGT